MKQQFWVFYLGTLFLQLIVACGPRAKDLSSMDKLTLESQRLNLPRENFLSETEVLIGGDQVFDPSNLERIGNELKIVNKTKAGTVLPMGNTEGVHWGNEVPIKFTVGVNQETRRKVKAACEEFGVRCVCRSSQFRYLQVNITGSDREYAYYPTAGQTGMYIRNDSSYTVILHELGHNLGLTHEQCRSDRDEHVASVMEPDQARFHGRIVGPFDYESVMLYPCPSVSLHDDSLCQLNGFINGRTSRGDRDAKLAYDGTTDLSDCVSGSGNYPPPMSLSNYQFRLDSSINGQEFQVTLPQNVNTISPYLRVTNMGSVTWDPGEISIEIYAQIPAQLTQSVFRYNLTRSIPKGDYWEISADFPYESAWTYLLQSTGYPGAFIVKLFRNDSEIFPQGFIAQDHLIRMPASQPPAPSQTPTTFSFRNTAGQPVTGVRLQISESPTSPLLLDQVVSGSSIVITMTHKTYYVRQKASGYQQDNYFLNVPGDLSGGAAPIRPLNPEPPPASLLTIIVSDSVTGQRVAGAGVNLGYGTFYTDAQGMLAGNVLHGSYSGTASKSGYNAKPVSVTVSGATTLNISLVPIQTLTPVNVALGKPVAMLTTTRWPAYMQPASNLTDGNDYSFAYPGEYFGAYEVDLLQTENVTRVEIVLHDFGSNSVYINQWRLEGVDAAGNIVGTLNGGFPNTGTLVFDLPGGINIRKIRFGFKSDINWVAVYELKAFALK